MPQGRRTLAVALLVASSCWFATVARGSDWVVSLPDQDFDHGFSMGEGQIAVVPPGVHPDCLDGRMVFANDAGNYSIPRLDNATVNTVFGFRDLDSPVATPSFGVLRGPTSKAVDWSYTSNDHNLIALADGRLVYTIVAAYGAMPASGKPWWFDYAQRKDLLLGARAALATYVSTDCGQSFDFAPAATLDSYFAAQDVCANPQPGGKSKKIEQNGAVVAWEQPFDMGGSDGPRLSMDAKRRTVFATTSCEGLLRDVKDDASGKPRLAPKRVDRMDVFAGAFDAAGQFGWRRIAKLSRDVWRSGVVSISKDLVAVNATWFGTPSLWIGTRKPDGSYVFIYRSVSTPMSMGWSREIGPLGTKPVSANMLANAEITRWPGLEGALLFFPTDIPFASAKGCIAKDVPKVGNFNECGRLSGYRVLAYRGAAKDFVEIFPRILPRRADGTPNSRGIIAHLSVSDPGEGPVLVHWYDIDGGSGETIVRARLYTPDSEVQEFVLSRGSAQPRTFNLTPASFFGDFKAGDAWIQRRQITSGLPPLAIITGSVAEARFYPMWTEQGPLGEQRAHTIEVIARRRVDFFAQPEPIIPAKGAIATSLGPPLQTTHREPAAWRLPSKIPTNVLNPEYVLGTEWELREAQRMR